MTIRAVLCDFDHTLVDSPIDFALMRNGVLDLLREAGCVLPNDAGRRLVLELVDELAGDRPALAAAAEAHIRRVEMAAAAEARPIDGASEALAALRGQGRRIAILTRNAREVTEQVLGRIAMPHDLLLCRDDVPAVKPDPAHARAALAAFDLSPAQAALVGDFTADIACAVAAGVLPIGVLTGHRGEAELRAAGAAEVLPSVAELPAWLMERGW